jgi:nucleotide-binding universal stress UspA family protein
VRILEGDDPALEISKAADEIGADVVILGATKQIFNRDAWESVSARVMIELGRPVLVVPEAQKATDEESDAMSFQPTLEPTVPA